MTTDQQQFGALPPAQPKKKSSCLLVGLIVLACVGGCVGFLVNTLMTAGNELSEATDEIFAANASGKWGEIYDQRATPELQAATDREGWMKLGDTYTQVFGKLLSKTGTGIHVNTNNGVTTSSATYSANFEKGKAIIDVNFRKIDGAWKLNGINVKFDKPQAPANPPTAGKTAAPEAPAVPDAAKTETPPAPQ